MKKMKQKKVLEQSLCGVLALLGLLLVLKPQWNMELLLWISG